MKPSDVRLSRPKWRVVLPLEQPYDTSTEDKQFAWKVIYTSARVVFGACARDLEDY